MNGNADGFFSPDITYSIDLLLYNLKLKNTTEIFQICDC